MTAHSIAWDEDSPAPRGTSESSSRSRPPHVEPALLERPQDTQRILGPSPSPCRGSRDPASAVVSPWLPKVDSSRMRGVRTQPDRHPGRPVDRERQHEPLVVVGVLADQVDAARRLPHAVRRRAEDGLEPGGQLPGIEAERHAVPSAVAVLEMRVMDPRYTPWPAAGYGGDHGPADDPPPRIPLPATAPPTAPARTLPPGAMPRAGSTSCGAATRSPSSPNWPPGCGCTAAAARS